MLFRSVLYRHLRGRAFWVMSLVFAAVSSMQASLWFARGGNGLSLSEWIAQSGLVAALPTIGVEAILIAIYVAILIWSGRDRGFVAADYEGALHVVALPGAVEGEAVVVADHDIPVDLAHREGCIDTAETESEHNDQKILAHVVSTPAPNRSGTREELCGWRLRPSAHHPRGDRGVDVAGRTNRPATSSLIE